MVNYTEPQLVQNLAAAELAGCVLIRQKDAASLYFDNHPSCDISGQSLSLTWI